MRPIPTALKTKDCRGHTRIAAAGIVGALLVLGALAWWFTRPPPQVPAPAVVALPALPPAPANSTQPRGPERKEALIDVSELIKQELSAEQLVAHARRYLEQNEAGPAFLLLRKAARQGSGEASFLIGRMYDPAGFEERLSPFLKARADRAYEWYEQAAKAGFDGASAAAEQVIAGLQSAADKGDETAAASLAQLRKSTGVR
ncbi:MAG: hypothetical protein GKR94_14945 [Gammaproteobacteria bacterium]|nr:hypothetical protein [Gammaproteobacteria bacterium]